MTFKNFCFRHTLLYNPWRYLGTSSEHVQLYRYLVVGADSILRYYVQLFVLCGHKTYRIENQSPDTVFLFLIFVSENKQF